MSRSPRSELLARAAGCYRQVGRAGDAVRCYTAAGEFGAAGRLHEQAGRLAEAARCFERANEWVAAAECYRRLRLPSEAADCLVRDGDPLLAAWVLAEEAHHFVRARTLALDARPRETERTTRRTSGVDPQRERVPAEPLADFDIARELVVARCDLGLHQPEASARRLDAVIDRVPELTPSRWRQRAIEWALALADQLRRPDLGALFHAACYNAGFPDSARRWEEWALRVLGDASGVPLEEPDAPVPAPSAPRPAGAAPS